MLVLGLESVAVVKPSSHGVLLEDVEVQKTPQIYRVIYQRPANSMPLPFRMDEDRSNFVAEKGDKASHSPFSLEHPSLRPGQVGLPDRLSLLCQEPLRREWCRNLTGCVPDLNQRLRVLVSISSDHGQHLLNSRQFERTALLLGLASLTYCQENDKPTNAAENNADQNAPGHQQHGGLPNRPYSSVKHPHLLADQSASHLNGGYQVRGIPIDSASESPWRPKPYNLTDRSDR